MKITLHLDIRVNDHSTPLPEDVANALRQQLSKTSISWKDPSLGRLLTAEIVVTGIDFSL